MRRLGLTISKTKQNAAKLLVVFACLTGIATTVLASDAIIETIRDLRATTKVSERNQYRSLTLKLANAHAAQARNLNTSGAASSSLQNKITMHRMTAIKLYEEFITASEQRFEPPTGGAKTSAEFNLSQLYADLQQTDKAKLIWRRLSSEEEHPQIASQAALLLAEHLESSDPSSLEALRYYKQVALTDGRQDTKNYCNYRIAWIERNRGKFDSAIDYLKLSLWDSKGHAKDEIINDLISFHALSGITVTTTNEYIRDLSKSTKREDLIAKLADAYLAVGKKEQAVITLSTIPSKQRSLLQSLRLLEESYGLRNWSTYAEAMDQIQSKNGRNELNKKENTDVLSILKRLVVQLDAEKTTQPSITPYFIQTADLFISWFPKDEDTFRIAASTINSEKETQLRIQKIKYLLDDKVFVFTPKQRQLLYDDLISAHQTTGDHSSAAGAAHIAAEKADPKNRRRYRFVQGTELLDAKRNKAAAEVFKDLINTSLPDEITLKSQLLYMRIMGLESKYVDIIDSGDKFLSSIKVGADISKTTEYKAIVELRDQAEFEHAAMTPNANESIAVFLKFCYSGKFAPKSCQNAETTTLKNQRYDDLVSLLKFQKRTSEAIRVLESSARFTEAAKQMEAHLTDTSAVREFIHIAILYEIDGREGPRDRVLKQLMTRLKGQKFESSDEEHLVLATLTDAKLNNESALSLRWSSSSKCKLLHDIIESGSSNKRHIDDLLRCPTAPGPGWSRLAMTRARELDSTQAKIDFYSGNSKQKFQQRLSAIQRLAKEVDRLLPAADSLTYQQLASLTAKAFEDFANKIIETPLPDGIPESEVNEVKTALTDTADPFLRKRDAYAKLADNPDYGDDTKNSNPKAARQLQLAGMTNEVLSARDALKKDPLSPEKLKTMRDTYSKFGNPRVASYFEGRIRQLQEMKH